MEEVGGVSYKESLQKKLKQLKHDNQEKEEIKDLEQQIKEEKSKNSFFKKMVPKLRKAKKAVEGLKFK